MKSEPFPRIHPILAALCLLAATASYGQSGSEAAPAAHDDTTHGSMDPSSKGHTMKHSPGKPVPGAADLVEYRVGDLVVSQAHSRATPPGAKVAGGYLSITNLGATDDILLGGHADFAGRTEVHSMELENDVMKMREMKDGLVIPAGTTVELAHGGYHLMFKELRQSMRMGQSLPMTLLFDKAGELDIELSVVPLM